MTNLESVAAIYGAFATGDVPAILNFLADDVQWEAWADNSAQKAGVSWMAAKHGKPGALEFFQTLGTQLAIKNFQVLSLMGNETQVAAEITIEFELLANGHSVRDEEIHLWTFGNNGKVVRFRHYLDTAKHIGAM